MTAIIYLSGGLLPMAGGGLRLFADPGSEAPDSTIPRRLCINIMRPQPLAVPCGPKWQGSEDRHHP